MRDGRVVRLQGDPRHPVTRGFLCERTNRFLARQYSPRRLSQPLLRKDGELAPVSWDESLDRCAAELLRIREQSGPEAILHYRSGGSLGLLKGLSDLFFHAFGPVTVHRGSVCDGAGSRAQQLDFGASDSNDVHDLLHARSILLWGKNPSTSSPHLLPVLCEARGRGARILLIDPIVHRTASLCDAVIQPNPGGDLALALAVGRVLFERGYVPPNADEWCAGLDAYRALVFSRSVQKWADEAGVAPHDIVELAETYAAAGPSTILVGWGMQRRTRGCATVRAIDALALVTGQIGAPGAGVSFCFQRRAGFDQSFVPQPEPERQAVREAMFAHDILAASNPPIRFVSIVCGNPVVMLPDSEATARALRSREFVLVVDSFLTDTAAQASVVLPCTTMLEDDDLVGAYGHHYLGALQPVVPPPAGVRTDLEIFQALATRVGLGHVLAGDATTWKRRMLGPISLESLQAGPVRSPVAPTVVFAGRRFPTEDGRARLIHEIPEDASPPIEPRYPLRLMAVSTPASQCSQWSPEEPDGPLVARLHPQSASGAVDGGLARLVSQLAGIDVVVKLDRRIAPGLVVVPKGGGLRAGRCANQLLEATLTDNGEGAALYEQPVRLVPVAPID
ncbi:MAG: molybdopterin-dependent oxidoreductase [Polyangiaceae bacterium]|nr:molybdopterin-dependent oxidoreductase [Polyangiaceae bacterium]